MTEFTNKQKWALNQYDELALKLGKDGKTSYSQAAKIVGVSDSVISQIRNGKYNGNSEKNLNVLVNYFENREKNRNLAFNPVYAETSVSKDCYEVIRFCHILGRCSRITGDAGIGKTKAAIKYAEDYSGNCILITANPTKSSMRSILKELGKALNIKKREVDELYDGIIERLHGGMIIIIDEAQFLNAGAINTLRSIPDYFERMGEVLGLCLIGNHSLKTKFEVKNNDEIYEQIGDRSRFKPEFYKSDISKDDIALLIPQLAGKDMELEFLHKLMKLKGSSLRSVLDVYTMALNNENISYEGLKVAAEGISRLSRGRKQD